VVTYYLKGLETEPYYTSAVMLVMLDIAITHTPANVHVECSIGHYFDDPYIHAQTDSKESLID
jgi:hypothetical protein